MPTPEKFIIPIGPQHPALKEPGHFEFTVDGETVTAANVRLGYVHRGIEKATEDRNWTQNLYLLERICGICSHTHATCYSLGVEQLAEVVAPPRAQAIRSWCWNWSVCTATCCGSAWPGTRAALIRCSCIRGATAKQSWTSWKA